MANTGMPAWKLTASCIWNSFRATGKRHLLLTGSKGSGKTTLLKKLTQEPLPGITTWAVPGEAVWLKDNLTGEMAEIGRFDPNLQGATNIMRPISRGFSSLGIPSVRRCMGCQSDFVSLDEIGYLEQSETDYQSAVLQLFEKKQVIAVIRKQPLPFSQALLARDDAFVIDMDNPFGPLGCIIMASGEGKRFGSNKLMAPFLGKPMIAYTLDATDVFQNRVVVTRSNDVAALCQERGVPAIAHCLPRRNDTVRLGMEHLSGCDGWIFCQADQPRLSADTLMSMGLLAANDRQSIWRAAFCGCPGSPILFPGWARELLKALPEGMGGGALAKKFPEKVRLFPVMNQFELADVDTRSDLCALQKNSR